MYNYVEMPHLVNNMVFKEKMTEFSTECFPPTGPFTIWLFSLELFIQFVSRGKKGGTKCTKWPFTLCPWPQWSSLWSFYFTDTEVTVPSEVLVPVAFLFSLPLLTIYSANEKRRRWWNKWDICEQIVPHLRNWLLTLSPFSRSVLWQATSTWRMQLNIPLSLLCVCHSIDGHGFDGWCSWWH